MICPKCKTGDVYLSQRNNDHFWSFLWVNLRCHRCCHLFRVSAWKTSGLTGKPATGKHKQQPHARTVSAVTEST